MKRCWTGIESYFPLHRVRKWYFRHSGIPIFLLKLKMCRQESEAEIIHRVLADQRLQSGISPSTCFPLTGIWKRSLSFAWFKRSWLRIGPLWHGCFDANAAEQTFSFIRHFQNVFLCLNSLALPWTSPLRGFLCMFFFSHVIFATINTSEMKWK